jgi:iron complex outermembrane recepter protein
MIFTPVFIFAQRGDVTSNFTAGQVSGTVVDSAGRPQPGAVVILCLQATSAAVRTKLSDEKGAFVFTDTKDGNYFIRVSMVGYKKLAGAPFDVIGGTGTIQNLVLEEDKKELDGIVIISKRPVVQQKIDMTVINVDESVRKVASNALEILKLAPGVTISDNEDDVSLVGKSGVQVMLNGKLVRISLRDLLKLLKSMPATSVSQVEVITNPSSKYDVKGNTGILNIKTKKNTNAGLNGNTSIGSSQSKYNMGDVSTNLNYGINKLNLSSYVAYHWGKYRTKADETRPLNDGVSGSQQFKINSDIQKWSDPIFRLQADYYINAKHTIGALVEMEKSSNNEFNNSDSRITKNGNSDTVYITRNAYPNVRKWNTYNLNYRYSDTLGNDFNFDIDRSFYGEVENRTILNSISAPGNYKYPFPDSYIDVNTTVDISTARGDYSRNFSKGNIKLETGFKISHVLTKNNYLAQYDENGSMKTDTNLTNNFRYTENVQAVYANLGKNYSKWGIQAGLRLEHSDINGKSKDLKGYNVNKPDSAYFNLLPSAFINFVPKPSHAFRLSFTQQITRPEYESLRPFNYQLDQFFVYVGNPGLKVQLNSNTEFSYTYKNSTTFSASYNYTSNYFTQVNYLVGQVLYETKENTGISKDWAFWVNRPQKITEWWTSTNRVNVFYNSFRGRIYDSFLDAGKWGYGITTSQRFVLPGKYILNLSGRYTSGSRQLIYNLRDNGSVNISIGKRYFKEKGVVRIGMTDIFRMQKKVLTVDFSNVKYVQNSNWESRRVYFEFSYKFGSSKIKGTRDRETGNSDEKQRAGK